MITLTLTAAECEYLTLELPVDVLFDEAGGPDFRVQFLTVRDVEGPHEFAFDENELWLLDHILRPLARTAKLPDGLPLRDGPESLLERIWSALVDVHSPSALAMLRHQGVVVRE
jgi:hypothetical protein